MVTSEVKLTRSICTCSLTTIANSTSPNVGSEVFFQRLHPSFVDLQDFCLAQGIVNTWLARVGILSAIAAYWLFPITTFLSVSAG